ncbi:MAG: tryptophan synthase subunit alpha [Balneolaceae bacterium]|nr:tryptophan synthase subunit alpha [Balneolaceae bacterium]MDR9446188.1 tryptophan synthase subunit alpha [Balneolaceae bacterium]
MNRLTEFFQQKTSDDLARTLYITAGLPTVDRFQTTLDTLVGSGASILEIGMPFSDPLADGPTIQKANELALKQGVNISWILEAVQTFRQRHETPVVLMGYINPVIHYGIETFAKDCARAGVDGVILPDVPLEEMGRVRDIFHKHDIALIGLLTPTSTDQRIQQLDTLCRGFLYIVMVTGVTGGSASQYTSKTREFLERVRGLVKHNPVMAGFGIQQHSDIEPYQDLLDGFIVGSALLRVLLESKEQDVDDALDAFLSHLQPLT